MKPAPVVLFVYNRPRHTQRTLDALSGNALADQTDLFIFADGPKPDASEQTRADIAATRRIIHSANKCKSTTIIESETNKGLAASIIDGVTQIVNQYGSVIVLEDDIVTGKNFLRYMNDALNIYIYSDSVWHITGWRYPVKNSDLHAAYLYPTMECWGWATWADRWQHFEKNPDKLIQQFSDEQIYRFNADGANPGFWDQVIFNKTGKLNTWAIFWHAAVFLHGGLCVAPKSSLVRNIGIDASGTNITVADKRLLITKSIDNEITDFPTEIKINEAEYLKNKRFMKKIRKISPFRRLVKFVLQKAGLFAAVKKVYYAYLKKKI